MGDEGTGDKSDCGVFATARGRSERSFGTWQGRLPQELRLAGITSAEGANAFLRKSYIEEFNRKFKCLPRRKARHSGEPAGPP
jgi:hypothetical protein